jgi:hypothetical protein
MKKSVLSVVAIVLSGAIAAFAQDPNPEVPGDNFSLEGALELFKKSSSPEEFEKRLNDADSKVNNLDLNGDGYIDYIRVLDRNEGNVHAFVLQAVISESEYQDVAVIELEKQANGKAVLQIVGDEDIYGIETIIEPTEEVRTYAGTTTSHTVVNVWAWPSVQYVYGPSYSVWISPWGWRLRPVWWHTWRPVAYVYYYPIWRPYRRYYAVCDTYRIGYAHRIYRPYRTTSVVVYGRHRDQIEHYRSASHDRGRDGRVRYENGRYYADNSPRESRGRDIDHTRRSVPQTDVTTPSGNRSRSTDRSVRPDAERNSSERRRAITADRSTSPVPEVRTPAENRRRSVPATAPVERKPAPTVERRSTPNLERTQRTQTQRAPAQVHQEIPQRRSSAPAPTIRQTRPQPSTPSVNRSRSSAATHSAPARSTTRSGDSKSSAPRRGRD